MNTQINLFPVAPHLYHVSLNCFSLTFEEGKDMVLDVLLSKTTKQDTIVLYQLYENIPVDMWLPHTKRLMQQRNCKLVLDSIYRDRGIDVETVFLDYAVLRVNYEINILKKSTTSTSWRPDTDRFLFLTGKPNKLNRALLLKKFLDAGLENHCIWSLYVGPEVYELTREMLAMDPVEFADWVQHYSRSPDKVSLDDFLDLRLAGGFPYNHHLYEQTSFRVISETQFDQTVPHVTEKTWLPVVNYHPWIMAGNKQVVDLLQSWGMRTFHNYQDNPDYYLIDDHLEKLDAIVHNAKTWLRTMPSQQAQIRADIRHNITVYQDRLAKNINTVKDFCATLGIDIETLYRSGFFSDIVDMNWLLFYNNIKDSEWPDCLTEMNFYQLPKHIQTEIVGVFGHRLKHYVKEN